MHHERDHVNGQLPGGEPGIRALVGRREPVTSLEVAPIAVANRLPAGWRERLVSVSPQPAVYGVVRDPLAPEEAGVRLEDNTPGILEKAQLFGRLFLASQIYPGRRFGMDHPQLLMDVDKGTGITSAFVPTAAAGLLELGRAHASCTRFSRMKRQKRFRSCVMSP